MHFDYKEYDTVTIKGMRWYRIDGFTYPSVTSVLGGTMSKEKQSVLDAWRNSLGVDKAAAEAKRAADRGTRLHLMTEQYLKGEEINVPDATHVEWGMFNSLKPKLNKIGKIAGQEVVLYSHGLEIAGRCDCIAEWNGELCIIDFKTSNNHKNDKMIEDYKYQLCAYAICHNEMFDTNIKKGVVLMGVENGMPLEFKIDLEPFIPKLFHRVEEFYQKLSV